MNYYAYQILIYRKQISKLITNRNVVDRCDVRTNENISKKLFVDECLVTIL